VGRFLLTRILDVIPVLIGVTIGAFAIVHLVPGDPARILLGPHASPAAVARLHQALGLDQSLPTQYWHFIRGAVTFHFGTSIKSQDSVASDIAGRVMPSLLLVGYSLLVSLLIAVPLGTLAAVRRGGWTDQGIRILTTVAFVMPSFWLGLLLIEVVSVQLGLLPTSGYGTTAAQHLKSLTLPAITVGLGLSPLLLRQLRSNVIDTMQTEYVEAARVRGLSEPRVLFKHVMRNSVTSTVTLVGIMAGVLVSLVVVIENVFSIPGLGSLLVGAVSARDFPMIQALTLVLGVCVVVSSVLTDLVYAVLDPRVRL
jgi:peptide/nickel transport system permease protein